MTINSTLPYMLKELLEDLQYMNLAEKLTVIGVFLFFGIACFLSGFLTHSAL